jgi:UDP-glucose 4-epimerase
LKNILITGGAGYIGSHSLFPLKEQGYNPIVYDNLSEGHEDAVKSAELIVGDVCDEPKLDSVFKEHKIDAVMHFAGSCYVEESVKNPQKYFLNNVVNTLVLLKIMLRNNVNKLVFSSSCSVYGEPVMVPIKEDHPFNPRSPYGTTKLYIEQILDIYARSHDLKYAALRYFNAAGASTNENIGEDHLPETHLIPLILKTALKKNDTLKIYGDDYDTHDGTCIRDYVHVEDIVSAHILTLKAINERDRCYTFNIGNGTGYTIKEVIAAAEAVTETKIDFQIVGKRTGDVSRLVASPEKINKEIGWEPKFKQLNEIIYTAWNWHNNNQNGFDDKGGE